VPGVDPALGTTYGAASAGAWQASAAAARGGLRADPPALATLRDPPPAPGGHGLMLTTYQAEHLVRAKAAGRTGGGGGEALGATGGGDGRPATAPGWGAPRLDHGAGGAAAAARAAREARGLVGPLAAVRAVAPATKPAAQPGARAGPGGGAAGWVGAGGSDLGGAPRFFCGGPESHDLPERLGATGAAAPGEDPGGAATLRARFGVVDAAAASAAAAAAPRGAAADFGALEADLGRSVTGALDPALRRPQVGYATTYGGMTLAGTAGWRDRRAASRADLAQRRSNGARPGGWGAACHEACVPGAPGGAPAGVPAPFGGDAALPLVLAGDGPPADAAGGAGACFATGTLGPAGPAGPVPLRAAATTREDAQGARGSDPQARLPGARNLPAPLEAGRGSLLAAAEAGGLAPPSPRRAPSPRATLRGAGGPGGDDAAAGAEGDAPAPPPRLALTGALDPAASAAAPDLAAATGILRPAARGATRRLSSVLADPLAAGTHRASQHLPGYAGHVPAHPGALRRATAAPRAGARAGDAPRPGLPRPGPGAPGAAELGDKRAVTLALGGPGPGGARAGLAPPGAPRPGAPGLEASRARPAGFARAPDALARTEAGAALAEPWDTHGGRFPAPAKRGAQGAAGTDREHFVSSRAGVMSFFDAGPVQQSDNGLHDAQRYWTSRR